MLRNFNPLRGCTLTTTDGEIGKVREMYFDDEHWTMRYLVVTAGSWLTGRDVLIAPRALGPIDAQCSTISVNLTREQVRSAPSIDTDKPVSRQFEERYYQHYGWTPYWSPPGAAVGGYFPAPSVVPRPEPGAEAGPEPEAGGPVDPAPAESQGDQHLRSSEAVRGRGIQAKDGEIGHVDDFIIDDSEWRIRYLVIDTRNWWPGKHVLLAPDWIEKISYPAATVFVNLPRSTIKSAPEYDADAPISRSYEERLHDHYGYKAYWDAVKAG